MYIILEYYIKSTYNLSLGLGVFLVEQSFFLENERNNQEWSQNERLASVLKNIGTISKRTEQNETGI